MRGTININDEVLLTETNSGYLAFDKYHRDLGFDPGPYRAMAKQRDGRLKMPLWHAFEVYGPFTSMGSPSPFENGALELVST